MGGHTEQDLPGLNADYAAGEENDASAAVNVWRRVWRSPTFWISAVTLAALLLLAAGADVLSPYDPNHAVRDGGLSPGGDPVGPSERFVLGTDRLGRDYLSRLLHGARTSLLVGIAANFAASIVGTVVGAVAAFAGTRHLTLSAGRWSLTLLIPVETLLMRTTDVVLAMPALLLAIALASVIGPSLALVITVIALLLWTTTARVVYSRARLIRELEFVLAARALGASGPRIVLRHVAPHLLPLVVVYGTLGIAGAVLFEATLSFLGVGVAPPAASWGNMIAEHASYFRTDPRLLVLPGLTIMLTVLAFNLLGDTLHDALDRRGRA